MGFSKFLGRFFICNRRVACVIESYSDLVTRPGFVFCLDAFGADGAAAGAADEPLPGPNASPGLGLGAASAAVA